MSKASPTGKLYISIAPLFVTYLIPKKLQNIIHAPPIIAVDSKNDKSTNMYFFVFHFFSKISGIIIAQSIFIIIKYIPLTSGEIKLTAVPKNASKTTIHLLVSSLQSFFVIDNINRSINILSIKTYSTYTCIDTFYQTFNYHSLKISGKDNQLKGYFVGCAGISSSWTLAVVV